MQKSLDVNSATVFSHAVFYTKNVLTEAVFGVRTSCLSKPSQKNRKIFLGFLIVNLDHTVFLIN